MRLFLCVIALFTASVSAYPGAGAASNDPAVARFIQLSRPQPLENAAFVGPNGQAVDLQQFRGQIVMINLWATWCPPCVRELPSLQHFRADYANKGVVVVPVAVDSDPAVVMPFLQELGLPSMQTYFDNQNSIGEVLPADLIPATYILDQNGQLVAFVRSFVDWDHPAVRKLVDGYLVATP
ncbi:TlpA disulfide reductase family protein [uncultured Ferrimonas sp.]|uniref:TlpA family protein disulfide reductase n=1 Tax=uncultured Ferrimonas sp. TaxID=432640 RepID=UPI00261C3285|nr:TlpA disulfide reductase family protein [uncultured Ferrimonas sp.]